MTRYCVYCDEYKPEAAFKSVEHVWPKKLGKKCAPELLMSKNVCDDCNLFCGLNVDGKFLKSFFGNKEIMQNSRLALDPENPKGITLTAMGFAENFPCPEGCKAVNFLGPCGEQIYYVDRDSFFENWFGFVEGDPRKQNRKGDVYYGHSSSEPFWTSVLLKSLKKTFGQSKFYCATEITLPDGKTIPSTCPQEVKEYMFAGRVTGHVGMNAYAMRPLMAKLGLGIGYNLFGDKFAKSSDAQSLRRILCQPPHSTLNEQIEIANYSIEPVNGILSYIYVPSCWTIYISAQREEFILVVIHPSGAFSSIKFTQKFSQEALIRETEPICFVACPSISEIVGPIDFFELIGANQSITRSPIFSKINAARDRASDLQPKNIAEG